MQRSNGYTIVFTTAVTVVVGVILAIADLSLSKKIKANQLNEMKSNILSCVTRVPSDKKELEALYDKSIEAIFVDANGKLVENPMQAGKKVTPESFNIAKAYKLKKKADKNGEDFDVLLPVYKFRSRIDTTQFEAFVIPMYGAGLWDDIWGYMAIESDFKTIKGVIFDHKAETPGLGARITNNKGNTGNPDAFQERFKKKMISGEVNGKTVYINVAKSETNNFTEEQAAVTVNGLSGASMTTKGVTAMLSNYVKLYEPYFKSEAAKMEKAKAEAGPEKEEEFNVEEDNKAVTH